METLAFVLRGPLAVDGGAGASVIISFVDAFLKKGFSVEVFCVYDVDTKYFGNIIFPQKKNLKITNLNVSKVAQPSIFRGSAFIECWCYRLLSRVPVKTFDLVIYFESYSLILKPYLASDNYYFIYEDPLFEKIRYGEPTYVNTLKSRVVEFFERFYLRNLMLRSKGISFCIFGSSHGNWLSRALNADVKVLRPSVFVKGDREVRHLELRNRPSLVFGGSLDSRASRVALESLNKSSVSKRFDISAVGWTRDIGLLQSRYRHIRFLGSVENFEVALATFDIFIMLGAYPVGVRTRLCSALSAGNICLVDKSVYRNMPELKNCRSVFWCGVEEVDSVIDALSVRSDLDDLKLEAKRFFDEYYSGFIVIEEFLS